MRRARSISGEEAPRRWQIIARAMRDVQPDRNTREYSQWLRDILAIANSLRVVMPELRLEDFVRESGV